VTTSCSPSGVTLSDHVLMDTTYVGIPAYRMDNNNNNNNNNQAF
jgi:hypothetical protein